MKYAIALIVSLGLTACSWGIKLDAGGTNVRVAWNDDVSHCRVAGAITVSVLDKVGPVGRSRLSVPSATPARFPVTPSPSPTRALCRP